jgi:hypothetical protein
MRYQKAIEILIKQIDVWDEQADYSAVSEHISVLLNALSSKTPDIDSAKKFIRGINITLFNKLIEAGAIQTLQVFGWVSKTLRLANLFNLTQEQQQLVELQEELRKKIENTQT